jgi:hypothetical protein
LIETARENGGAEKTNSLVERLARSPKPQIVPDPISGKYLPAHNHNHPMDNPGT